MPFQTPSYGGQPIFGLVTSMQSIDNPAANQADSFFGVGGTVNLFGGTRGRLFQISGVFEEEDIPGLNSDEAVIRSFIDGIARTLIDTRGRSWSFVIFKGEYQPDPMGPRPSVQGWCLPYKMVMHGLS
jgi:hypothetical protein